MSDNERDDLFSTGEAINKHVLDLVENYGIGRRALAKRIAELLTENERLTEVIASLAPTTPGQTVADNMVALAEERDKYRAERDLAYEALRATEGGRGRSMSDNERDDVSHAKLPDSGKEPDEDEPRALKIAEHILAQPPDPRSPKEWAEDMARSICDAESAAGTGNT